MTSILECFIQKYSHPLFYALFTHMQRLSSKGWNDSRRHTKISVFSTSLSQRNKWIMEVDRFLLPTGITWIYSQNIHISFPINWLFLCKILPFSPHIDHFSRGKQGEIKENQREFRVLFSHMCPTHVPLKVYERREMRRSRPLEWISKRRKMDKRWINSKRKREAYNPKKKNSRKNGRSLFYNFLHFFSFFTKKSWYLLADLKVKRDILRGKRLI